MRLLVQSSISVLTIVAAGPLALQGRHGCAGSPGGRQSHGPRPRSRLSGADGVACRRTSTTRISGFSSARPTSARRRPARPCPTIPRPGARTTKPRHIPGAGFLDLPGELSRQDAAVNFMMLPPAEFAKVMSRHGIGDGHPRRPLQPRARDVGDPRLVDAACDGFRRCRGARWRLRQVAGRRPSGQHRARQLSARDLYGPPAPRADRRQGRRARRHRRARRLPDQHAERSGLQGRGAVPLRAPGAHPAECQSTLAHADRLRDRTGSSRSTRPSAGSRRLAPRRPSGSSAIAAVASRRPWASSSCTAWATPTLPSTTPRWPNGRATRPCRSSGASLFPSRP